MTEGLFTPNQTRIHPRGGAGDLDKSTSGYEADSEKNREPESEPESDDDRR